jgi:hypothetical protein
LIDNALIVAIELSITVANKVFKRSIFSAIKNANTVSNEGNLTTTETEGGQPIWSRQIIVFDFLYGTLPSEGQISP